MSRSLLGRLDRGPWTVDRERDLSSSFGKMELRLQFGLEIISSVDPSPAPALSLQYGSFPSCSALELKVHLVRVVGEFMAKSFLG